MPFTTFLSSHLVDSISNQTRYITMFTSVIELNLHGVVLHETVEIAFNWII